MSRPPSRDVAALALASLPCATQPRLATLIEGCGGDPERALRAVQNGRAADVLRAAKAKRANDVASTWRREVRIDRSAAQIEDRAPKVWLADDADYPIKDALPGRPAVLLGEGARFDAFDAPRVGIVGTRAATPQGIADAHEIGAFCARAGITVVSGLAIGIDGAAHEGALDAGGLTVGVVATGLDVVYPRRHTPLFERVRAHGVLVSEHGYGVEPLPERFPIRNRIIAALADVLVVVEATLSGGTNATVKYASDYGRPVYVVPGSRRNPSAAGSNALFRDGATPLLEPGDLLFAFGRLGTMPGQWQGAAALPTHPDDAHVLHAFGGDPATIDDIERAASLPVDRLGRALRRLEQSGHLQRRQGLWWPT